MAKAREKCAKCDAFTTTERQKSATFISHLSTKCLVRLVFGIPGIASDKLRSTEATSVKPGNHLCAFRPTEDLL